MGTKVDWCKTIFVTGVFILLCGCSVLKHYEQLSTLGAVARSQKEVSLYVERQRRLFKLLLEDIKKGNLKRGILESEIIRRYGEPILSEKVGAGMAGTRLLYRDPVKFFSSDKVYLYFGNNDRLVSWEYIPFDS